ncbi:MAG: flagellar basal body P-ring protein FlgI [Burkholderiales bacterium]|nr:flagellar basal body P-ring protein FlgI [Phycisphaerae bacterium]
MKVLTAVLVIAMLFVSSSQAARIADVTRLSNQRTNVITGWGLVFGLKGTGDGGDFLPAMRPLAEMLRRYGNPASVMELGDAKNVAIVTLTATIPATGARDGDKLDVYVTSIGSSATLRGGRLFVTPMEFRFREQSFLVGWTQGAITLEDPSTPAVGVIKNGCVLEGDFPNGRADANGMFRLIIDDPSATWTMSSSIARIINDSEDGQIWAWAISEKEVAVRIPPAEQQHPDGFISRIQRLPLPIINSEARVMINQRTGTIVVTGDVEISPVVISHKGLTISTILPAPQPTTRTPVVQTKEFVAIDTTNTGGAKLQDLINALDQLKVPVQDRIDILKELHQTGKLHAKLVVD